MKNLMIMVTALSAVAPGANAFAQRITVGRNVHVSAVRPDIKHNETTIAADPADAKRLLACTMLTGGVAAYASFDGGLTWSAPAIKTGVPRANDPTCAYGPNGSAYFMHKIKETAGPSDIDRLAVHRSNDGGRTFEPLILGPQTTDRPWVAIDTRKEAGEHGRIFISYNYHVHFEHTPLVHKTDDFMNAVALQASVDGGRSFGTFAMRALRSDSTHSFRQPGMIGTVVLSDGSALLMYEHGVSGGANPKTGKQFYKSSSLNVLRSRDGGVSVEPAIKVADIESSYNLPNTRGVGASLAADPGSVAYRDRIYAVWADVRSGRTEILSSYSADRGDTWSAPVVVNDDAPRTGGGPDHFMPVVAVNRDGVAGVMWYDRRDHADNLGFTARFSASMDGGVTWLPSVNVSEAPHIPKSQSGFDLSGGDTAGLAAAADGRFHALWVDTRTGTQQAWTAAIIVTRTK
jgi:hypothetical protein